MIGFSYGKFKKRQNATVDKFGAKGNQGRGMTMIRSCNEGDFDSVHAIINDAAQAYRGVIPDDCWHEPYMPVEELQAEMEAGVIFHGYEDEDGLLGVMGIQPKGDVYLIRHAYVRSAYRNRGIGSLLLQHLYTPLEKLVLVGTWADAGWAIRFYQRNGFSLVSREEKDRLLQKYWSIPKRQVDTSVVLADAKWINTIKMSGERWEDDRHQTAGVEVEICPEARYRYHSGIYQGIGGV
jgi:GNAT superfamily N-acetyltransferase